MGVAGQKSHTRRSAPRSSREHPLVEVEPYDQAVWSDEIGSVAKVGCWPTTDVDCLHTGSRGQLGQYVRLVGNGGWRLRNLQHVLNGVRSRLVHRRSQAQLSSNGCAG